MAQIGLERRRPTGRAQTQKKWAPQGHVRTGSVDDKGRETTGNTSAHKVSTTKGETTGNTSAQEVSKTPKERGAEGEPEG